MNRKKNAFLEEPEDYSHEKKINEVIQILREVYKESSDKTINKYSKLFSSILTVSQKNRNNISGKTFIFYPGKMQIFSKTKQNVNVQLTPLHSILFYYLAKHHAKGKSINHHLLHNLIYSENDRSISRINSNITGINKKIKPLGISIHHKQTRGWFIKEEGEEC